MSNRCIDKMVREVLNDHTGSRHSFEGASVRTTSNSVEVLPAQTGGVGVCAYVWVNGKCYSHNCLDLTRGVYEALRAIEGVRSVKINLD